MRYHPHTEADITAMLKTVGVSSVPALFNSIPNELRLQRRLDIPAGMPESEMNRHMRDLSDMRPKTLSFLGAGANHHFVPSVVDSLLRRSEFYTSYTPYQPEITQGTLQAIFEFQTMTSELFGLPVANASMYDGASALAEAVLMTLRIQKGRSRIVMHESVHPDYRDTVRTYLSSQDTTIVEPVSAADGSSGAVEVTKETACVVLQTPNFFGIVEDVASAAKAAHAEGAILIVVVPETLALGLIEAPGKLGADVVVGEGFSMVGGPSFGGPAVGMFAAKEEYLRQLPGRLVGEAKDKNGERGYVLTLSTREQHIRRDKATSNICTNQGLIALGYAIHLALLGPLGLRDLAEHNLSVAHELLARLEKRGVKRKFSGAFFNEFAVQVPNASTKLAAALKQGVVAGLSLDRFYPAHKDTVLVCVNESHNAADLDRLAEALS